MGYNIGIYCEPELWNSEKLQIEINNQNSLWGQTTIMGKNGYFLKIDFGSKRAKIAQKGLFSLF